MRLRAIEPDDGPIVFARNQDDEQARGVAGRPRFPRTEEAVQAWARHEAARTSEGDDFRFVIVKPDGGVVDGAPWRGGVSRLILGSSRRG